MELYFGGSEIPGHLKMLAEEGVEHVSLSFMGLRRRTKFAKPWLLSEKYPDNQKIFLDSGAYTVNSADDDRYSIGELRDIATTYLSFVDLNLDRFEFVSEFDCLPLGREWIEAMREDYWDDLPDGKFLPIWHGEQIEELDRLCQRYARVGILQTTLGGRNLTPTLNSMVQKYGTRLHGMAMTKPDEMAAVRWDSVASTSWLSPSQYGDTIVWTNNGLKRYPKKYKDQARKRHRTLFEANGFSSKKIEADDTKEILRVSIWSWKNLIQNLDRHTMGSDELATTLPESGSAGSTETTPLGVDTPPGEVRNSVTTVVVPEKRATTLLPVMGVASQTEVVIGQDGTNEERSVDLLTTRSASMRMCNTCFLKDKCPAFKADANCAYDIPVTIQTKSQMRSVQDSLIEMQTQRVLFMRMAEDMEGGYADPNLSSEMDRLQKMIKTKTELESDSFSVKFEAKGTSGSAQAGLISRMFGREAGERAGGLPEPLDADVVVGEVIDVDAVDVPRR